MRYHIKHRCTHCSTYYCRRQSTRRPEKKCLILWILSALDIAVQCSKRTEEGRDEDREGRAREWWIEEWMKRQSISRAMKGEQWTKAFFCRLRLCVPSSAAAYRLFYLIFFFAFLSLTVFCSSRVCCCCCCCWRVSNCKIHTWWRLSMLTIHTFMAIITADNYMDEGIPLVVVVFVVRCLRSLSVLGLLFQLFFSVRVQLECNSSSSNARKWRRRETHTKKENSNEQRNISKLATENRILFMISRCDRAAAEKRRNNQELKMLNGRLERRRVNNYEWRRWFLQHRVVMPPNIVAVCCHRWKVECAQTSGSRGVETLNNIIEN